MDTTYTTKFHKTRRDTEPLGAHDQHARQTRRRPSEQILGPRDIEVLGWVANQYAGRVDHLQHLLGCGERQTQRVIARLRARNLVHCERLSTREPRWLVPTPLGLRLSLTGFRPWHPHLVLLAHCAAVNDVRLYIEQRSPDAVWTSERELARKHGTKGHLPDGVVLDGDKNIGIEVELTPKAKKRTAGIIDRLCASYDVVLYFASPNAYENLTELAEGGRWPALGIRELPTLAREPS
jgi:hypothetical protein